MELQQLIQEADQLGTSWPPPPHIISSLSLAHALEASADPPSRQEGMSRWTEDSRGGTQRAKERGSYFPYGSNFSSFNLI